jgi:hypothetical protein
MPPPPIKSRPSGFTRLSSVILAENPDASMLAHTKGCEGNPLVGTQIRSLRMTGLLDGASNAPTAGHPLCHFALVALGSSDPTQRVLPSNPELW